MDNEKAQAAAQHYIAGMMSPRRKWEDAWAPYRKVLAELKLPPRGKKGSKANWKRLQLTNTALHAEKLRLAKQGS
jgi:hypothetical protein